MYSLYLDSELMPVTPEALDIKINNKNSTISLADGSEYNFLNFAGLTDIDFTLTIPQFKQPYAQYENGFLDAQHYLDKFELLKQNKKPFQFIFIRQKPNSKNLFDTNIKVSLEDYKISEKASNGFDIQVKISLKQYVYKCTQKATIKTDSQGNITASFTNTRDNNTLNIPKFYYVNEECSLITICKKYLGDDSLYRDIAKLNNISDVNHIQAGTVIKLKND